jgi:hypothetical protein
MIHPGGGSKIQRDAFIIYQNSPSITGMLFLGLLFAFFPLVARFGEPWQAKAAPSHKISRMGKVGGGWTS